MSTYARLQISGSGAFDEPNNGIDIYPTENPVSGKPRTTVVRIPGKKGGVHQHGGLDNAKIFLRGVAYGDETVRDSKETGLENLGWHTGTLAWRGRPITLSVVHREGYTDLRSTSDPGLEDWTSPKDLAEWIEWTDSAQGYITQSTDNQEGTYAAELITNVASARLYQLVGCTPGNTYTFSAHMKSTDNAWDWRFQVFWLSTYSTDPAPASPVSTSNIITGSSASGWTIYSATLSAPTGANWMNVQVNETDAGYGLATLTVDGITTSGDDSVPGYTKSYAVQMDNYQVKTRRGTNNIHDVRVNLTEWTD